MFILVYCYNRINQPIIQALVLKCIEIGERDQDSGVLSHSEFNFLEGLVIASFYLFAPQGRIGGMAGMTYR